MKKAVRTWSPTKYYLDIRRILNINFTVRSTAQQWPGLILEPVGKRLQNSQWEGHRWCVALSWIFCTVGAQCHSHVITVFMNKNPNGEAPLVCGLALDILRRWCSMSLPVVFSVPNSGLEELPCFLSNQFTYAIITYIKTCYLVIPHGFVRLQETVNNTINGSLGCNVVCKVLISQVSALL